MRDLKAATGVALKTTRIGVGMDSRDMENVWAVFRNYIDRVVIECVNELTPKWSGKLAGFDVFIWDQCYAMEQSLRID
jgi:hypothetical protein